MAFHQVGQAGLELLTSVIYLRRPPKVLRLQTVLRCCPSWSAVVQSHLTAALTSPHSADSPISASQIAGITGTTTTPSTFLWGKGIRILTSAP
ncbi:hypothetical protein AAY473_028861, partial [Plecturocebus cupreus]